MHMSTAADTCETLSAHAIAAQEKLSTGSANTEKTLRRPKTDATLFAIQTIVRNAGISIFNE